jgi:hypothetical protein
LILFSNKIYFQVATLVTLYNYLEDSKSAAQILNEAVDRLYNLDQMKEKNSRALAYLIKQNIIYQEKQGNGQRVTEMLEILHKYLLFILF